ncbi:sodium/hydrogen exchanger family protein [Dactylonectria estremocensis]|uniref:Sodium/hydrogen exchanger family protein n=1 Tax=Dactylonectria estremocensis TaxID=1079267 RepID=A0A9P9F2Y4_9HYPO|nr:sodium/hydrogen exchanger family protein [Dactylonectria estremocensis]
MAATITDAASKVASVVKSAAAATTTAAHRAPPQGGVIEGANPSVYNPKDPITMFIIQAGLIIIVCHLLHWPLAKIRQPRVIAEVIGGIVLGPSVMGHIPGFKAAIFPPESIPNLTLVANIGLVLYLFLIGLETDVHFLVSHWRVAVTVAFAGIALPFGLGCAVAWGLYNEFQKDEGILHIDFSVYMLFIGVAIAITAFPVLCRILTELKLLDTSVGVITLSAGVANDVVGWILLALCVALVNAGNGIDSLWILLTCVGYMLFLMYLVKPSLTWLLRRTGSIENGPSQSIISLILLCALASAFFTGIIGVHAIFGGFMFGLILPRENGFAIKVTEKLEDFIGALFLPLYFTLSGLNTNLGLLDNAITWGYVFAVTFIAFTTKFVGASIAARLNGLVWRESFSIGVLMSCKGLVELIVLNIGLQAKILSTRTFTIFVVMALITTFSTTPLAALLYPPWYQKKLEAWKRGEIDWDTGKPIDGSPNSTSVAQTSTEKLQRLLVYLRFDNMPATLRLVLLFGKQTVSETITETDGDNKGPGNSTSDGHRGSTRVYGIRLTQLTDRDSSVMTVAQINEYSRYDPLINTFRTAGQLNNVAVSGEVAVIPESRFAEALVSKSHNMSPDLLLIPWSNSGSVSDSPASLPWEVKDRIASPYAGFVKDILQSAEQNVAVFLPKNGDVAAAGNPPRKERNKLTRAYSFTQTYNEFPSPSVTHKQHHIILPYFGGDDDKLALLLVFQLCDRPDVTCSITPIVTSGGEKADESLAVPIDIAKRVKINSPIVGNDTETALDLISTELSNCTSKGSFNLVVLARGLSRSLDEGKGAGKVSEEAKESLGTLGAHYAASDLDADLLVLQAKRLVV